MIIRDYFINISNVATVRKWHRDSNGLWKKNTVLTFYFISDGKSIDFIFYDHEDDEELEEILKKLEVLFNDSGTIKTETC